MYVEKFASSVCWAAVGAVPPVGTCPVCNAAQTRRMDNS
jgi:hypothetical protein